MNTIYTWVINRITNFIKSAWTMKLDFVSLAIFIGGLTLTGAIAGMFPGGWAISNLLYAIAICAVAVHLPWLFIALTFPKSINEFINNSWDSTWARMKNSTKLMLTLGVYCLFVLIFAIIAWAVFVGVPVGG